MSTQPLRSLKRNRPIAERRPFRTARDYADVKHIFVETLLATPLWPQSPVMTTGKRRSKLRLYDRVRTCIPISLFKLFPGHNRLYINHSINRENPVQMIDLMLQQLGEIFFVASREL